jgi:hypothetical protein
MVAQMRVRKDLTKMSWDGCRCGLHAREEAEYCGALPVCSEADVHNDVRKRRAPRIDGVVYELVVMALLFDDRRGGVGPSGSDTMASG